MAAFLLLVPTHRQTLRVYRDGFWALHKHLDNLTRMASRTSGHSSGHSALIRVTVDPSALDELRLGLQKRPRATC